MHQLWALRYLLRQGMAIRGHTEIEGNLHQLLKVWANDNGDIEKVWENDNIDIELWLSEKSICRMTLLQSKLL